MLSEFTNTTITTDENITIHVKYGGKGAPLLLLHGYPQAHLMWHKIAPLLAKNFTVIMPEHKIKN